MVRPIILYSHDEPICQGASAGLARLQMGLDFAELLTMALMY